MLRTSYVRISEPCEPDSHLREETPCPLNIEPGVEPENPQDTPDPGLVTSEILKTPDPKVGQGLDLNPPTHHKQYSPSNSGPPNVCNLMYVQQQPQETVHPFWSRFLLVKNKIKDCCDDDAVLVFCRNCTDEGILSALNRRRILHCADLAHIVQKYCAMESAWEAQTARWEPIAFTQPTGRAKRMHPYGAPDHQPIDKKTKPFKGYGTVLDKLLDKPCQIHAAPDTKPMHSLWACWVLRQVAKSGEDLLTKNTAEQHPMEGNDPTVLIVFETFA